MPRTLDFSKVQRKIVNRKPVVCRICNILIGHKVEYVQVGSKRMCLNCYEKEKAKFEHKQQNEEKKANKTNELQPERKCPSCGEEKNLEVIDYNLASKNLEKGMFVFKYRCQCGEEFSHQKDV